MNHIFVSVGDDDPAPETTITSRTTEAILAGPVVFPMDQSPKPITV
jgi:hypothetical protein